MSIDISSMFNSIYLREHSIVSAAAAAAGSGVDRCACLCSLSLAASSPLPVARFPRFATIHCFCFSARDRRSHYIYLRLILLLLLLRLNACNAWNWIFPMNLAFSSHFPGVASCSIYSYMYRIISGCTFSCAHKDASISSFCHILILRFQHRSIVRTRFPSIRTDRAAFCAMLCEWGVRVWMNTVLVSHIIL